MAIIDTLLGKARNNKLFNLDNVSFQPNPENLSFEPNLQNTSFTGNPDMTNFNADQPSLMQRLGNNISTGVNRGLGAIRNLDPMSGINDMRTGYQENVSTPFNVGNLQDTGKGLAQKFGELGGTLRRFADTGLGRGLITAGLVGATGGDASDMLGYGMQAGVTRQGLATQDRVYRQQLEDMGIDTSDIRGNITEDIYKNIISSRRLQQMTYGELAQLDPTVAAAVQANPMLYNQVIPSTVANSILGKKGALADVNIEKIKAQTEDIKNPKPRVNISRREGGTKSTVEIKHTGGSGGKSGTTVTVRDKYQEGQTATNPKTGEKMIFKGGKWQKY